MNSQTWITALLAMFVLACSGSTSQQNRDETYANAMEKEHAAEKPDPSGAEAQARGAVATATESVVYGTIGDQPLNGFIARPASGPIKGGIIVIHEWWGLNSNVKEMADKFASHGYVALAVDLYGGKFASKPDEAKALMMAAMQKPEDGVANLKAARAFLAGQGAAKIAVLGWCFGGGWSLEAGLSQGDDIAAVVMYYGRVKTTPEDVAPLSAPLLGIFAALDQGIPLAQVREFEAALKTAGKDAQIVVYDGVDHAFANPSGERYAKDAADDAWIRTLAFLDANI